MRLLDMLRYRRPEGCKTERDFIRRFILPLDVLQDGRGNLIKHIPNADGSRSNVMWSSHTDTVHREGGFQKISVNRDFVWTEDAQSNCLGADCTTGVWLMIEMIEAGKPGLYVFHRAEEIGRVGSKFIMEKTPDLLNGIDACIAFDRKSVGSIITHQMNSRCCSEEFSKWIGDALGLGMKSDSGGSYTDSASYVTKVPECTNLSVGYYSQHSSHEYQDLRFAAALRDSLVNIDMSKMVVARDPKVPEVKSYGGGNAWSRAGGYRGGANFRGPYAGQYDEWDLEKPLNNKTVTTPPVKQPIVPATKSSVSGELPDNLDLIELISSFPEEIAAMLEENGLTAEHIRYEIYTRMGFNQEKVA